MPTICIAVDIMRTIMWKYNIHIPCHDIKKDDIVRLDISYDSKHDGDVHGPVLVIDTLRVYRGNNSECLSNDGRLFSMNNSRYAPVWINGNICKNCVYYRKCNNVEI